MSLHSYVPQERYISPEVELYDLCPEQELLTVSGKQNEDVAGKDDPDLIW